MKKQTRLVSVYKEREVKTYANMWHTSLCLLKKGIDNQEGSFHQFMASIIFTAFTLEAYLNHIGIKLFNNWSDHERLGPREKLDFIANHLGVTVDHGKRPWQIMKQLFGFRNDIAHGKSETIKTNEVIPEKNQDDEYMWRTAETKWEKFCNQKNAIRAREDVEKIVNILHEEGAFEDDYPFIQGVQIGSATIVNCEPAHADGPRRSRGR